MAELDAFCLVFLLHGMPSVPSTPSAYRLQLTTSKINRSVRIEMNGFLIIDASSGQCVASQLGPRGLGLTGAAIGDAESAADNASALLFSIGLNAAAAFGASSDADADGRDAATVPAEETFRAATVHGDATPNVAPTPLFVVTGEAALSVWQHALLPFAAVVSTDAGDAAVAAGAQLAEALCKRFCFEHATRLTGAGGAAAVTLKVQRKAVAAAAAALLRETTRAAVALAAREAFGGAAWLYVVYAPEALVAAAGAAASAPSVFAESAAALVRKSKRAAATATVDTASDASSHWASVLFPPTAGSAAGCDASAPVGGACRGVSAACRTSMDAILKGAVECVGKALKMAAPPSEGLLRVRATLPGSMPGSGGGSGPAPPPALMCLQWRGPLLLASPAPQHVSVLAEASVERIATLLSFAYATGTEL